jgi:AcrR family transcriptional regulator
MHRIDKSPAAGSSRSRGPHRDGTPELYRLDGTLVLRKGVARLTLETAPAEAGVSKGGVLYHFPTRAALVAGMVERLGLAFQSGLEMCRPAGPETSFALAHVREAFLDCAPVGLRPGTPPGPTGEVDGERGRRLNAAVLAAAASEPELLQPLRDAFTGSQRRLEDEAPDDAARRATIGRLAADGLWLCAIFGFDALPAARRPQLLAALERLVR